MIDSISFSNDPNIGLYAFATDDYCLVGGAGKKEMGILQKNLGVKVIPSTVSNTSLLGIFCAGNSNGIVVPDIITKRELESLKSHKNVLVVESKHNALGNLLLANDKGCMVSEKLRPKMGQIKDFLGVKTEVSTIMDLDLVGKGCSKDY